MNEVKRVRLTDRFKMAAKAFKGHKIGHLYFGMDVRECWECEYKVESVRFKEILRNAIKAYVFELDQHDFESDDELYSVLLNQFDMTDKDFIDIMGCTFKQYR